MGIFLAPVSKINCIIPTTIFKQFGPIGRLVVRIFGVRFGLNIDATYVQVAVLVYFFFVNLEINFFVEESAGPVPLTVLPLFVYLLDSPAQYIEQTSQFG